MVVWHRSESTVEPLTVDDTLSKVYVYLRKNITEEERTDENGNTVIWYVYDEAVVSKEDYYEIEACISGVQEQTETNTLDIETLGDAIIEMSEIIYA